MRVLEGVMVFVAVPVLVRVLDDVIVLEGV